MAGTEEGIFPDVYANVRGTSSDPDLEHDGSKPHGYGIFWRERDARATPVKEMAAVAGGGRHRRRRG